MATWVPGGSTTSGCWWPGATPRAPSCSRSATSPDGHYGPTKWTATTSPRPVRKAVRASRAWTSNAPADHPAGQRSGPDDLGDGGDDRACRRRRVGVGVAVDEADPQGVDGQGVVVHIGAPGRGR